MTPAPWIRGDYTAVKKDEISYVSSCGLMSGTQGEAAGLWHRQRKLWKSLHQKVSREGTQSKRFYFILFYSSFLKLRWNLYHTKLANLAASNILPVLYPLSVVPKHFHHPKRTPVTTKAVIPCSQLSLAPVICFLLQYTYLFWIFSYKWNHTLCDPSCLDSFMEHIKMLTVHPCCSIYHTSFLFRAE